MTKRFKYLFALGLPLALAGFAILWMLEGGSGTSDKLVYDTVVAGKGTIRKVVATSGPVRALVTVSVGSQLSGLIDKLYVDYNSEVKEGDVLATLDDRTFSSRVAQAKADLAVARAGQVNQEAALKKADAVKRQAELNVARQTALQQKGFAATATLDTATRDIDVANAEYAVAVAMIESAKAVVAQREASLHQAEIDLERTKILAPINGTVISRTADVGQTVAASLQAPELFKIAQDLRRIRLEAQVNEADVGQVAEGNPVTFTVDAYPDRTFQGKVTQVRLAATELQNVVTYTVIIEASNDDRRLFPGMTANVQIEVAQKDNVVRVPNDALRFRVKSDSEGQGQTPAARLERTLSRLKTNLDLNAEQESVVREQLQKMFSASNGSSGGQNDIDPAAARQRLQAAIEQILQPMLTEEQKPLFEKWKRGRETTKSGTVYVLDASGVPERRYVRIGVSDDVYSEIVGGQLNDGERVVIRAREAQK